MRKPAGLRMKIPWHKLPDIYRCNDSGTGCSVNDSQWVTDDITKAVLLLEANASQHNARKRNQIIKFCFMGEGER